MGRENIQRLTDFQPHELKIEINYRFPDVVSVVATGSSFQRSSHCEFRDIDIIGFDPTVEEGEVLEHKFELSGREFDVTLYHPLHFLAVVSQPKLTFAWLREIRKIYFGLIIYDDGTAERLLTRIKSAYLPSDILSEMNAKLKKSWISNRSSTNFSVEFFRTLELAIFLRMNSNVQTFYFKHKYLHEDADKLQYSVLPRIIKLTTEYNEGDEIWLNCAERILQLLYEHEPLFENINGLCRDLKLLIERKRIVDSKLVARFTLLRSILRENQVGPVISQEITQLIDFAFMVGKPMNNHLRIQVDLLLVEIDKSIVEQSK